MASSLFPDEEMAALDRSVQPAQHPFADLITHYGVVLPWADAQALFEELMRVTPWGRYTLRLHGKEVEMPRDIACLSACSHLIRSHPTPPNCSRFPVSAHDAGERCWAVPC